MKFEVGDIIKGNPRNGYSVTNERMTRATVIESHRDRMKIMIDEHPTFKGVSFSVDNDLKKFTFIGKRLKECVDTERAYVKAENDSIKKVIFNPPATIVLWKDGTKTVVKCQGDDEYYPEHGLAMCICKKFFGNKGNFNDVFKKHCPLYEADDEPQFTAADLKDAAKALVDGLKKGIEDPALYNGKIKCVEVKGEMCRYYTVGKVYEVVDGRFADDEGLLTPNPGEPAATCFEGLFVDDYTSEFIEVEE